VKKYELIISVRITCIESSMQNVGNRAEVSSGGNGRRQMVACKAKWKLCVSLCSRTEGGERTMP
jgi:hypothetical protein